MSLAIAPLRQPGALRLLAKTPVLPPVGRHALGVATAALLALWLAFQLELDTPYSAATTVMIVSSPVQGMILSKSLYRLGGTLIGACMAVTLMALFGQAPEMFILSLSLWMGLCTAASTLLHNFRSYGAVLAGYTVVLIAMPGVDRPESIFDLAMARIAVVSIGIVCSAVVTALLTSQSAERTLERRLREVLGGLCAYCRLSLESGAAALTAQRRKLAPQIGGLDAMITYASAENAEVARLAEGLQGAAAAMFGALTAAAALNETLNRRAHSPALAEILAQAAHAVEGLDAALALGDLSALDKAGAGLTALRLSIEDAFDPADLSALSALDRLDEVLDELALCLEGLTNLLGRRKGAHFVGVKRHLDWRWAAMNGFRAAVAVWLAGAIWYLSAWPLGGALVAGVVPATGLLSLRDRPTADAIGLFWGVVLASVLGFFYLLWVFPQITGFPLLALWMGPPLAFGAACMFQPKYAFVGTGFAVFFITLLAPSNPMTYDAEFYLNNAFATASGAALTALVYRLVFPVNARQLKRFLIADIRRDVRGLLASDAPVQRAAWEGRMHQRLLLLGARLGAAGLNPDKALRGGFAALRLGREVLRLRALLIQPQAQAIARPAIAALAGPSLASPASVQACRGAAEKLSALALDSPKPDSANLARAAASLVEIALLAGRERRFFQSYGRS
jgi:uncharacterized membrane protein YccC